MKGLQPRADGKEFWCFGPHPDYPGFYVAVSKTGRKTSRMKYLFADKEKFLPLGTYPATDLTFTRKKAMKAREQIACSYDPSFAKEEERTPDPFRY